MRGPLLIAAVGLPSCGKTSLFRRLGEIAGWRRFAEPEEELWPRAISRRGAIEVAFANYWFRCARADSLFEANEFRNRGEVVLFDSFFDKIKLFLIGRPGLEWMITADNPYYENIMDMAQLDYRYLPDADLIISIYVDKDDWFKMIMKRRRVTDNLFDIESSYDAQRAFVSAARQYGNDKGIPIVDFHNVFSSVNGSADQLLKVIMDAERRTGLLARREASRETEVPVSGSRRNTGSGVLESRSNRKHR